MSLVEHAKREIELAGLSDPGADYDGMIGQCALQLIEVFASQGHSGTSAMLTLGVFGQLAQFHTLTPITSDPDEWLDQSESGGGKPLWQNRRDSSFFSTDGGATWYSVDDDITEQVRASIPDAPEDTAMEGAERNGG